MDELKRLKTALRECRKEMREAGIRKTSCFNGGLDNQTYHYNARRFALETEIETLEKKANG